VNCKGLNRECVKASGHSGKCSRNHDVTTERNHAVTSEVVTCNQCAEKDAEIARLKLELARVTRSAVEAKPSGGVGPKQAKRDRAAYMRERRAKKKAGFIGVAYG
jgi:hypothetical protein